MGLVVGGRTFVGAQGAYENPSTAKSARATAARINDETEDSVMILLTVRIVPSFCSKYSFR